MKLFRKMMMGIVVMATIACSIQATAAEYKWMNYPAEKLGRGVANIAFGPLELLIKPYDVNNEDGAIAALTFGVFKGVFYTVAREVVGVVDVATFFMPLPGCTYDPLATGWGYGPIMRPAWVIDIEHNAYGAFYNDDVVVVGQ